MIAVTLEYNKNNVVLSGILDAVAKMPDVKITKTTANEKKFSISQLTPMRLQ